MSVTRVSTWWVPFLWVSLTPIMSVIALRELEVRLGSVPGLPSYAEGGAWGDSYDYIGVDVTLVAFLVQLPVVLVPLVFMNLRLPNVRWPTVAAVVLGVAHAAVPSLVIAASSTIVEAPTGREYFRHRSEFLNYSWPVWPVLGILFGIWIWTLFMWGVTGVNRRDDPGPW